jgi:uncharacterized membrane protein/glutaredoxin
MKIYKQYNPSENALVAFKDLLHHIDVIITSVSLELLRNHPEYPSLNSIRDVLFGINISSLGVKLSNHQLSEIPYPAIAHFHKNNGHFVVLQKLQDKSMHYIDPEVGLVKEPLEEFEKKWSGVALLDQANEKSGEVNYKENRKVEIFNKANQFGVYALIGILLLLPAALLPSISLPVYIIKILGGLFCFMLLQKQFGNTNSYISAFCALGSKSNCDNVIHSPASKLFGLIHLSELGVLYFAGSLILIALSAFSGKPFQGTLFILNLLMLPFTVLSIYYQWKVIKTWCPLCIAVMAILWFEFLALQFIPIAQVFSFSALYLAFFSFSLPLIFWLTVRQRFIDSFKVPTLDRNLNRFVKSERVFKALLEQETKVDIGNFAHEIMAGAEDAQVELTLVSNPVCGPCAYAHTIADGLVDYFGEKLKVNFRFAIDVSDHDSVATKMVKHLTALSITSSNGHVTKSLSNWFSDNGKANIEKWIERNPLHEVVIDEKINAILQEQNKWCKKIDIQATPTVFINGKRLPSEYSLNDLRYHLRHLVNN